MLLLVQSKNVASRSSSLLLDQTIDESRIQECCRVSTNSSGAYKFLDFVDCYIAIKEGKVRLVIVVVNDFIPSFTSTRSSPQQIIDNEEGGYHGAVTW